MRHVFLWNLAKLLFFAHDAGIKIICFTFYRSPGDQLIEFNLGRSRTINSLHQKWLAVDLGLCDDIDEDGKIDQDEVRWKKDPRYTTLGQYWESLGGVWGGRWKEPFDPYHFEWSKDMVI